jgi:hypothetical protein
MKKILLSLLLISLFIPLFCSAITINNLPNKEFTQYCKTENSRGCTYEDNIYIDTDYAPRGSMIYVFIVLHEIGHILFVPHYKEIQGRDEELLADQFAFYILTKIDLSGGFLPTILK